MTDNHILATPEITRDLQLNLGYITLCNCPVKRTEDQTKTTAYSLLADYGASAVEHITGIELINAPDGDIDKEVLNKDLDKFINLTEDQRVAVLSVV
jgi:hypothetical protein